MQTEGIHHVSINVSNVDDAAAYYVDILGLEKLDRPDFGFPGAWLKSGEQEVHLIGIESGPPLKEQHFAFKVGSIEAIRERLVAAGHKCSDSREIPGICLQAFSHDPSGNMVEFNQRL